MSHTDLRTFTPFIQGKTESSNPLRAYMQISAADKDAFDQLPRVLNGTPIEVFDEVSQQSYFVRPASCGGRCFCAAEIVRKGTQTENHY